MTVIALRHSCFGRASTMSYVKNKFCYFFFGGGGDNRLFKQNAPTKPDYNLEGFFPIYL